jgi:hypothetical protein
MALEFFTNLKNVVLDKITPDPDFTKNDIKVRKDKRLVLNTTLAELLNKSIVINKDGGEILLKDLPAKHEYWRTEQGKVDRADIKAFTKSLDGKYEMTYQELSSDEDWMRTVRKLYKADTGSDWTKTDTKLTEEFFHRFNDFANQLTKTAYQGVTDTYWFSEFSDEDLGLLTQAYDTFHRTDMTGLGSRNLARQVKDFVLQSGSDPITLASIALTGGASSVVSRALSPLVLKEIIKRTVANRAARVGGASITSAAFGGAIGTNVQMLEQRMQGEEELDIDPGTVALYAGGAALLPGAFEIAGHYASKAIPFVDDILDLPRQIQRAIIHPVKTWQKGRIRGKGAAAFGMLEAEEKAIIRGATDRPTYDVADILIDDVINPASRAISDGFSSLKYKDLNVQSQQQIRNLYNEFKIKNTGVIQKLEEKEIKEIDRILGTMFNEESLNKFMTANNLGNIPFDKWPAKFKNQVLGGLRANNAAETWQVLRNEIYETALKHQKLGNKNVYNKLMGLYYDLKGVQQLSLANPGEVKLWEALNQANHRFQTMLEKNTVGQFFAKIKGLKDDSSSFTRKGDHINASLILDEASKESEKLLNYILHDKTAFTNFMQFKKGLTLVDQTTKNVQKAINASVEADLAINAQRLEKNIAPLTPRNTVDQPATIDSYNQLMGVVRSQLGVYLEAESAMAITRESVPYAALDGLISRPNGLKLITEIFPEQKVFYEGLQQLKNILIDKVSKKAGQSVIINMTVARMAADLGTSAAGKFGGFAAPVMSVPILQRMRNLLGDSRWQRAMADTINNNGQIPTWFSRFLRKTGKSDQAISELQRDWSIIIYGTAIPKFQESTEEQLKEKPWSGWSLKDMYGSTTGDLKSMSMFSP